jgi:hypothetical protein
MTSSDKTERNGDETTLFDIADWLWSFRLLALGALVLAALWTSLLVYSATGEPSKKLEMYVSVSASATPIRGVSEIADILATKLASNTISLASAHGANPVILWISDQKFLEEATAKVEEISNQLVADVASQTNLIRPYLDRDVVPDSLAVQYLRNVSFLEAQKTGLLDIATVQVKAYNEPARDLKSLLIPGIICGLGFLGIAAAISFMRSWAAHRRSLLDDYSARKH